MRHQVEKAFIQTFNEDLSNLMGNPLLPTSSPTPRPAPVKQFDATSYAQPFIDYISDNPTVFHAVSAVASLLSSHGFVEFSERSHTPQLRQGGKYYVKRNDSSIIAFIVGESFEAGNGASIIASHIDALTAKLKPISGLPASGGYLRLGVAPYAGGLNSTWFDRDLGIGGRVLLRNKNTNKIQTHLVKLDWPVARIPTLAPHFGQAASTDRANKETEMVPIIGVDNSDLFSASSSSEHSKAPPLSGILGDFASRQPPALVEAILGSMNISASARNNYEIINWDLELFDFQPATVGGIDKSLLFAGRLDDKLCSWAAITALLGTSTSESPNSLKLVACFDNEEIGSLLRQGARSNFLMATLERITASFLPDPPRVYNSATLAAQYQLPLSLRHSQSQSPNLPLTPTRLSPSTSTYTSPKVPANILLQTTLAKSFLLSADVGHALNPNYASSTNLSYHSPRLNTGISIQADPNGHTTTDAVSSAILQRFAARCKPAHKLQVFQIRNDSRSGGTVGPMLSSALGCRAIDAGIVQLSMHSIRACTGIKDVGLGVQLFRAVLDDIESVLDEFGFA